MTFDEVETDTLNLRVAPSFKATLKAVADAEHRSMMNMPEVLLANYCSNSNRAHRPAAKAHTPHRAAPKHKLTP